MRHPISALLDELQALLERSWPQDLAALLASGVPLCASTPSYAATARTAAGSVSTANTNRDGTGTIATIFTAGASGSRIEEIVIKADADPADCTIVFYLHDGSNYFVYDEWDIGNPAAGSATVASYREARVYDNLFLPNGWSLRASITAAPTAGTVKVLAAGGDF